MGMESHRCMGSKCLYDFMPRIMISTGNVHLWNTLWMMFPWELSPRELSLHHICVSLTYVTVLTRKVVKPWSSLVMMATGKNIHRNQVSIDPLDIIMNWAGFSPAAKYHKKSDTCKDRVLARGVQCHLSIWTPSAMVSVTNFHVISPNGDQGVIYSVLLTQVTCYSYSGGNLFMTRCGLGLAANLGDYT